VTGAMAAGRMNAVAVETMRLQNGYAFAID
jgi:hypothetical protein